MLVNKYGQNLVCLQFVARHQPVNRFMYDMYEVGG